MVAKRGSTAASSKSKPASSSSEAKSKPGAKPVRAKARAAPPPSPAKAPSTAETRATTQPAPRAPASPPDAAPMSATASMPEADGGQYAPGHDLFTTASASNRLGTFVKAIGAAGLRELLTGAGPFTVFAPSDRAFAKIPRAELDALMRDRARLSAALRHHVVTGLVRVPLKQMPAVATTVDGAPLTLTAEQDAYRVLEAKLVQTNLRASNGVIHVIDTVLMPR